MSKSDLSRRAFLGRGLSAAAAPWIVPASVLGAAAPSNRVTLGFIGVGNQGSQVLQGFLQEDDCQVLAVCDVNRASYGYKSDKQFLGREVARKTVDEHYAASGGRSGGCAAYIDFRQVLGRADIDAVVIAVPDHWHAVMTCAAARAGKDIYCEKPLSLTVEDGQAMVREVRRCGVVLQAGTHERSNGVSRFACELVRNGYVGQLRRVQAVVGPWNKTAPPADWKPMDVPEDFDYERWLGPAPWAPYHKDRCLYNFRFLLDYSGGQVTNYGAHSLDLAQWGHDTERTGPVEVADAGSVWPSDGLFDVALEVHFRARYADGVELECITRKENMSTRFEGSEGWVEVGYGGFHTFPESLKRVRLGPNDVRLYASAGHYRNFLDCVKSRREPAAPVEVAHRSATLCHLGNIAMLLKRPLKWDPRAERFVGDDQANRMLGRARRAPWTV
ncbi:MAG: 1,5-anhydro-D-fructose reductase [Planctomycetes bacterium ADurb.Bin126]|nr:MAG: 1,5-anhydro-D-fructose reductase [Planctomycetes bacterium ADurb.Bin126]HOD83402.1 Gfo/Idh/MocA family oxidoreductase [Phycisphaerae bacterium]HQL74182.1 Gfo/Idh/MocA family oxidoreductase [Phycisphaerae bacterium]